VRQVHHDGDLGGGSQLFPAACRAPVQRTGSRHHAHALGPGYAPRCRRRALADANALGLHGRTARPAYPEHIHARDDKLLTSRLWRPHFETRRGILIVNSFNEGEEVPTYRPDRVTPTGRTKTVQWSIRPGDGSRLAIAVIFHHRATPEISIPEFVMCTTKANRGIARFVVADPDQRMPAVLKEEDLPVWLGEVPATPEEVHAVLQTYEDDGAWDMQPESTGRGPSTRPATGPEQGNLF